MARNLMILSYILVIAFVAKAFMVQNTHKSFLVGVLVPEHDEKW